MRPFGHVARIGETRKAYKILVGNLKGRDHLEDLDGDESITVLKYVLKKLGGSVRTGFI
jgi:hypothetical protein